MKSLLSLSDLSSAELNSVLDVAGELKRRIKGRQEIEDLEGVIVGMLFEKPSTRTRASFEVAALRLGGHAVYLASSELQLSRGEPVKDTARILGGYLDVIVGRVYSHHTLEQFARHSGIPVINALSDLEHPTQTISDLLTIREVKRQLEGITIAFIGDGNNVCNSLLLGASMVGANIVVACPKGYHPNAEILARSKRNAEGKGSSVTIVEDPKEAARGADVLYTDVWVSMGEEAEKERRLRAFRGFQINSKLLELAAHDAVVMHCLPAHRGLEITDDVIEGKKSIVWEQGENKLYGAAASLEFVLEKRAQRTRRLG
ncbi:MAG: ornithine carbamoyltransferase [Thaumarchaeota archaeon]|nr:ornithine carbamoyltransferase [Nitrososphaerota archaeon]